MNEKEPFNQNNVPSHSFLNNEKKPIEIYLFIDPLCPECWTIEPILKKLQIEYGRYFSIKHILSGRIGSLNLAKRTKYTMAEIMKKAPSRSGMSCDGRLWFENPISSPFLASVAIKAAELQGKRYGIRFLRRIQEMYFFEKQNISNLDTLIECAKSIDLDVEEFIADFHSESAAKAFQCDLKVTMEMEVNEIPTIVFFNEIIEEEGIKITGYYPYEIYIQILEEMLQQKPIPVAPPLLENFIQYFRLVATEEIAIVYNMSESEVNLEMKKLQLMQQVEQIPSKYGTFWRTIDS